ncbi:MAG: DUF975 family protein [Eubacterium sp.]|nr:DUF975 family protein [Eubacterium sp.]MCM1213268.1 DUF975 family protein [Lachnospiraceae bacterium]MCM1303242.1 DUF975 family protein [Butyrivibrio sp.]MCM1343207.1 DUF975 family protein [Muribaculaceae bacterium]MCM1240003.1 DUF975 family protein [Lachnospiraceae bacterium]
MKQYKKPYELKNLAKDKLQDKYGAAVLILFLYNLIVSCVSLFIGMLSNMTTATAYALTASPSTVTVITVVFELINVAAVIVLGIMQVGITLFFLNIACGQPYATANLFYGFKNDSGKSLALSAAVGLCNAVCLYPSQYCLSAYLDSRDTQMLSMAFILMIVGFCVYVPISLGLSQVFYLMLDYPDRTAKETLALTFQVMKGNKRRLFYLQLSFIPMMILCICSFGIGFLWLNPYMQMTYTYFFLDMMNPAER